MADGKKIIEAIKKLRNENRQLRRLLWLTHGHTERLYGDDGEMQCFPCDFKRDPILRIEQHVLEAHRGNLPEVQTENHNDQDPEGEADPGRSGANQYFDHGW